MKTDREGDTTEEKIMNMKRGKKEKKIIVLKLI